MATFFRKSVTYKYFVLRGTSYECFVKIVLQVPENCKYYHTITDSYHGHKPCATNSIKIHFQPHNLQGIVFFFISMEMCCLFAYSLLKEEGVVSPERFFAFFFLPSHYRLHSGAQMWFCLQTESRHSKKVTFAYQWVDFKRNTVVSSESLRYSWAELNKKGGAGLGKWCLSFEGIHRSTNTWPPVCTFLSCSNMDILTFAKIQSISWNSLICDCPA